MVLHSVTAAQTITATYTTNNDCSKIAELLEDPKMEKVLDTLYSEVQRMKRVASTFGNLLTIEYASVWYNDSRGLQVFPGTKNGVQVPLIHINGKVKSKQLIHRSHNHPSDFLGPSEADYVPMCMFFLYDCSDIKTSTYSIMTKSDVMLIRMKDPEKFQKFIGECLIENKTPNWHNVQNKNLSDFFSYIFESQKIYAGCTKNYQSVGAVKKFISEMGLELYWGSIEDTDSGVSLKWNNTDFLQYTPIPLGCFTKLRNK